MGEGRQVGVETFKQLQNANFGVNVKGSLGFITKRCYLNQMHRECSVGSYKQWQLLPFML
jgi:hypothetical protein